MSQFDKVSFGWQILWFLGFFFISYFCMMRFILPEVYLVLKVREWRLAIIEKEKNNVELMFNVWLNIILKKVLFNVLNESDQYLNKILSRKNFYIDFCKNSGFMGLEESGEEYVVKLKETIIRGKLLR